MLTRDQILYLKSNAHELKPVVIIGQKGITDSVIKEVYDALEARELIKGCVQQGAPLDAKSALSILCGKTGAEPIQFIGRRFVMYRPSRENPRITIE